MFEEERFDFWWWYFFSSLFSLLHSGFARRWTILVGFHSQRKPKWGCCLTRGKSQATCSGVYACVRRASDGYENESYLSQRFLPSVFTVLWAGAMHDGCIYQPLRLPTNPKPSHRIPLCGGSGLVPFSVIDPFGPFSTHSTVSWTESPLRRQLLGHSGQAGRSGRRGWRAGGLVAATHWLHPHTSIHPHYFPDPSSGISTSVEIYSQTSILWRLPL